MSDPRHSLPSRQKRQALFSASGAAVVLLLAVSAVFILSRQNLGDRMIREGSAEDVREALKILIDAYAEIITLVTAAFGALAFLVTLQKDQGREVPSRAWPMLAGSIALLLLALCVAIAGKEEILVMMARNAVDLNLPVLAMTRWLAYGCMILAAICILAFAVEVMAGISNREEQEVS